VLVTGPGDATVPAINHADADGLLLRWNVGCGNVHAPHMSVLERLEQTAQDGRMSRDLQFPVVGWRVTNRAGRIKRSYVVRVRPTATQLPVYPTRPVVHPVTPSVVPPAEKSEQPEWVTDGLQPSSPVTGLPPVHGRTTPLPPGHISKRPVIGGGPTTTSSSGSASSSSGGSSSWLTVASSVLALTVVTTLPSVDRTMRLTSTDAEETSTSSDRQPTSPQSAPNNDDDDDDDGDDDEMWLTTVPDAETNRSDWTTSDVTRPSYPDTTSSTVFSDELHENLSTAIHHSTAALSTRTTTTPHQYSSSSRHQTFYQHASPSTPSVPRCVVHTCSLVPLGQLSLLSLWGR